MTCVRPKQAIGAITAVAGHTALLENHPHTKQSFALRRPYLLCLHAIQEAMARLKVESIEKEKGSLNDTMTVTVQGIAAGIKHWLGVSAA